MRCWGGSSTTIINNNFFRIGMPMCHPRPMFFRGGGCCGGGMNMFNMFGGFFAGRMLMSTMSNLFGFGGQSTMPTYSNSGYSPYRNEGSDKSCNCPDLSEEIADLTNKVATLESELASLKNNDQKEITLTDDENQEVKDRDETEVSDNSDQKVKKEDEIKDGEEADDETIEEEAPQAGTIAKKGDKEFEQTTEKVLNTLDKDLDNNQKSYVKGKITEIYRDDNGNIKYNITAIVHDTDSTAEIAKRFYKDGEKPDFTVGTANFNTQQSETNKIKDPHSGNIITLNGVSSYGLNALIQDAKDGITTQGEIAKTNKRIAQLKEDFKAGTKKLSWAYVKQNNIMDKSEYDSIISNKYTN